MNTAFNKFNVDELVRLKAEINKLKKENNDSNIVKINNLNFVQIHNMLDSVMDKHFKKYNEYSNILKENITTYDGYVKCVIRYGEIINDNTNMYNDINNYLLNYMDQEVINKRVNSKDNDSDNLIELMFLFKNLNSNFTKKISKANIEINKIKSVKINEIKEALGRYDAILKELENSDLKDIQDNMDGFTIFENAYRIYFTEDHTQRVNSIRTKLSGEIINKTRTEKKIVNVQSAVNNNDYETVTMTKTTTIDRNGTKTITESITIRKPCRNNYRNRSTYDKAIKSWNTRKNYLYLK